MAEPMNIEQACALLNEAELSVAEAISILNHEKWRGRDDWQDWHYGRVVSTGAPGKIAGDGPVFRLSFEDAIAIARGVLAERELAALRLAVEPFMKVARKIRESREQPGYERHRQTVVAILLTILDDGDWFALLATEPKKGENNG